jgi:hypothetical protein
VEGSSVIESNITMIVVLHLIVTVWNSMATTYNAFIFYLKNNFNFTTVIETLKYNIFHQKD